MSRTGTKVFLRPSRWILFWADLYTRGVETHIAAERRAELQSDLFEHVAWSKVVGNSQRRTGVEMLGRAVRGVPADLTWRRAVLRRDLHRGTRAGRNINITLQTFGVSLSLLVLAAGLYGLHRAIPNEMASAGHLSVNTMMLAALTGLALMGIVLLARSQTRFVGALWMIFPATALIQSVSYALSTASITFAYLYPAQSGIDAAVRVLLGVGLAVFFLSAALLWAPISFKPKGQ